MRNDFADEITKLGRTDERVMLLSGDIGNRLFDDFKEAAPGRFLNCGIGEANMMGMAAGLAMNGLRPVVYTITPFTTTRCFEQIRVDVCYHDVPVIIVGTGSGLSYGPLGPTHHSLEDLAILRTLPGMTVMAPSDSLEMRSAVRSALAHDGPVYIRIGKKGEPDLRDSEPDLALGKSIRMREGTDLCLIGAGTILANVLEASDILEQSGASVCVESFHTIKPLDTERLAKIMTTFPVVGIVEEHGVIGGLSGAISEWLANQSSTQRPRILKFGAPDEFAHTIGSQRYFRNKYGMSGQSIAQAMHEALELTKG